LISGEQLAAHSEPNGNLPRNDLIYQWLALLHSDTDIDDPSTIVEDVLNVFHINKKNRELGEKVAKLAEENKNLRSSNRELVIVSVFHISEQFSLAQLLW